MGDSMAKTKAEIKNAYAKKAYDDLRIQVKKGFKAVIKQYAENNGKPINGLVNELLEKEIPELKEMKKQKQHGYFKSGLTVLFASLSRVGVKVPNTHRQRGNV